MNAEDRPSFKDLVEKFDKMYAEPDRYLHDQVCASCLKLFYAVAKYTCTIMQ